MREAITPSEYMDYIVEVAKIFDANKDYITALDAKTGDGDHWVNMDQGFRKILENKEVFAELPLAELFKKIGMTLMSAIGGSSGILYGSAYISASKSLADKSVLDSESMLLMLKAMTQSIMERGKVVPGQKTMLDSIHEASEAYKAALAQSKTFSESITAMQLGAKKGMEATKDMQAAKGRATYQTNKGVGELDPGAVTMSMQLICLGDFLHDKK